MIKRTKKNRMLYFFRNLRFINLATVYILLLLPLLSHAGQDISISNHMGLQKLGEGNKSWFGLSIYTASLWGENDSGLSGIYDRQLMLSIHYVRNASSNRIIKSTRNEWKKLHGEITPQEERWLNYLAEIFPDISSGELLSSFMIPDKETRFFLGNKEIGRISDADFGPAFLAIWLDPRTSDKALRTKLLRYSTAEKITKTPQDSFSANL
jgi:hypothetical protein